MKKTYQNIRAFTLVELLVVIAIIALLTGIVMSNLTSSRAKARDAKRISNMGHLQLALELYFDRCKQYPSSLDTTANSGLGAINGCPANIGLSSYISKIPNPPVNPTDASATSYGYYTDSPNYSTYMLHIKLEKYNEAIKDNPPAGGSGFTCPSGANPTDLDYCLGPT
jgi:prepilin-type N-terminal cleavage/methylation domain-containing protein